MVAILGNGGPKSPSRNPIPLIWNAPEKSCFSRGFTHAGAHNNGSVWYEGVRLNEPIGANMCKQYSNMSKKDDWKIPQARSCVDIFHTIISRFFWKSQSMPLCKKDKSKAERCGCGSCRLCLSQSRNWRRTASDQIPPLCGSRRSRPSPTSAGGRWATPQDKDILFLHSLF